MWAALSLLRCGLMGAVWWLVVVVSQGEGSIGPQPPNHDRATGGEGIGLRRLQLCRIGYVGRRGDGWIDVSGNRDGALLTRAEVLHVPYVGGPRPTGDVRSAGGETGIDQVCGEDVGDNHVGKSFASIVPVGNGVGDRITRVRARRVGILGDPYTVPILICPNVPECSSVHITVQRARITVEISAGCFGARSCINHSRECGQVIVARCRIGELWIARDVARAKGDTRVVGRAIVPRIIVFRRRRGLLPDADTIRMPDQNVVGNPRCRTVVQIDGLAASATVVVHQRIVDDVTTADRGEVEPSPLVSRLVAGDHIVDHFEADAAGEGEPAPLGRFVVRTRGTQISISMARTSQAH